MVMAERHLPSLEPSDHGLPWPGQLVAHLPGREGQIPRLPVDAAALAPFSAWQPLKLPQLSASPGPCHLNWVSHQFPILCLTVLPPPGTIGFLWSHICGFICSMLASFL